ncbi:MAG: TRL-like family protein [Candidatus Gastranaerophilales bacterium]|nr:TRL-like family protein [Candidatus Gastranaerophilales bacterium]
MKKMIAVFAVLLSTSICANAEILGFIYQKAITPGDGYTTIPAAKTGIATCQSYFGIVGVGDCSVQKAMKNGKIKQLGGYDVYRKNILGYQIIKTQAWGN